MKIFLKVDTYRAVFYVYIYRNKSNDYYLYAGNSVSLASFTNFGETPDPNSSIRWRLDHVGNGYFTIQSLDQINNNGDLYLSFSNQSVGYTSTYNSSTCRWKFNYYTECTYRISPYSNNSKYLYGSGNSVSVSNTLSNNTNWFISELNTFYLINKYDLSYYKNADSNCVNYIEDAMGFAQSVYGRYGFNLKYKSTNFGRSIADDCHRPAGCSCGNNGSPCSSACTCTCHNPSVLNAVCDNDCNSVLSIYPDITTVVCASAHHKSHAVLSDNVYYTPRYDNFVYSLWMDRNVNAYCYFSGGVHYHPTALASVLGLYDAYNNTISSRPVVCIYGYTYDLDDDRNAYSQIVYSHEFAHTLGLPDVYGSGHDVNNGWNCIMEYYESDSSYIFARDILNNNELPFCSSCNTLVNGKFNKIHHVGN
ncbi:MAG: hypothetical protein VB118_03605 [Oscillospiraceae bacterium]|nr:hypothetical protein [Oscillospiraceae bacterium]